MIPHDGGRIAEPPTSNVAPAPTAFRQLHPLVRRPLSRPLLSVASSPFQGQILRPFLAPTPRRRYPRGRGAARVQPRLPWHGRNAALNSCAMARPTHTRHPTSTSRPSPIQPTPRKVRTSAQASESRDHRRCGLPRSESPPSAASTPGRPVLCCPRSKARRTLGISCEAPKFTRLRQLHPLVRRPATPAAFCCTAFCRHSFSRAMSSGSC